MSWGVERWIVDGNFLFCLDVLDELSDGVYVVDAQCNIIYWNRAAQELTGYRSEEVIGRSCSDNILMHITEDGKNLCSGGCALHQTLADGKKREGELFLHHKDGHRLPIGVRVAPMQDDEGTIIGAIEIFVDNSFRQESKARIKHLESLAMLDDLTELPNRRYMGEQLRARFGEMERHRLPFCALFLDLDDFKGINDSLGHEAGDRVLRMVSQTLAYNSRPFDVVGRWGGEEFLAIIPNAELETACSIAERYRLLVEKSVLYHQGKSLRVTVSIGATRGLASDTPESLLERADRAMYRSKADGKNRVTKL